MPSQNDHLLTLGVDKESSSIDDGRFILNPNLMPAVCTHCGLQGTKSQILRIKAPYDWRFWLAIGGFLGFPILFGVGAVLAYWIFGNDGLQKYVPYGVVVAVGGATLGGLGMSRSNRENWFLTYYFCEHCANRHKKLQFISRWFGWGAIVLLLTSIMIPAFRLAPETQQLLAYTLLAGVIVLLAGFFFYRIRMADVRGLKARWRRDHSHLNVKFGSLQVAEIVKSKLDINRADAKPAGGRVTSEEKDNDAIYAKLKQLALNDESAVLETDSQEFRLLGRLGALTQQKFLDQIDPFMTRERAAFVRRLRVDDGLTWRGIAEAWEKEFGSVADWNFRGNQLAGMALCELAAKLFAEDPMQPPWN